MEFITGDIISLPLTLLLGVVTGFIGPIVGGTALLSVPALILLGLPAPVAVATNQFGAIGIWLFSLHKFHAARQIAWKLVPLWSVLSLAGGVLGASILLKIPQGVVTTLIGIMVLAFLPLLFMKKDWGLIRRQTSTVMKSIGSVLYLIIGIISGILGGGTSAIYPMCGIYFFGLTVLENKATAVIPWLFSLTGAVIIFMLHGTINYTYGLILFTGMALGGYMGAHVAVKIGNLWLKRLLVMTSAAMALKILIWH